MNIFRSKKTLCEPRPACHVPSPPRRKGDFDKTLYFIEVLIGHSLTDWQADAIIALIEKDMRAKTVNLKYD